jgi:hypothetical protein
MARETKQAKLDPAAHERLKGLPDSLAERDFPPYVDQTDILSALVLYTPVAQLGGMLTEYWRDTRRAKKDLGRGREAPG